MTLMSLTSLMLLIVIISFVFNDLERIWINLVDEGFDSSVLIPPAILVPKFVGLHIGVHPSGRWSHGF
jgi:hypothetical protein